jgi:nitroreductase
MKDPISAMQWRYATKQYNADKKVADRDIDTILEATRLAPSSYGLQPYKMIVVTNPEIREKLKEAAYGQPQLTDATAIVIFAVDTVIDEARVDAYMKQVSDTRGVAVEDLAGFKGMVMGAITPMSMEARSEWAARQAYLGLGVLLETAAMMEIDTTPMEGFAPSKFDEILGLAAKGLKTVVVAAIGYRNESDSYIAMKKVRPSKEEMIIEVK